MKPIETLLRREIGLDPASVGSALIERTIRLRMKILGLSKAEDYQRVLESALAEWNELVESVVVTETWFYRDHEAFTAFGRLVREEWLPANPAKRLRVLSVPCSTGEEPYSLAMTLLDAGLPGKRFTIDAVDISARALERAQRAVYGKNSFRGKTLAFRARHFTETEKGYELRRAVCDGVQFHRGNLIEEKFFADRSGYDFIFCRNLLIYFDRATQGQALKKLHRLLGLQGVLFVGSAELPLVSGHGFAPANLPMAFACRKAEARGPKSEVRSRKAALGPLISTLRRPAPRPAPPAAPVHRAPDEQMDVLIKARQLADAGKLAEAAALCESHLETRGPCVEAYYLLGLVRDAHGDPQAVDCYRKALYLEPSHYESLLQLALLLEKNGDVEGARTLKRRAERRQQKS